jgi:hypothetical protein
VELGKNKMFNMELIKICTNGHIRNGALWLLHGTNAHFPGPKHKTVRHRNVGTYFKYFEMYVSKSTARRSITWSEFTVTNKQLANTNLDVL